MDDTQLKQMKEAAAQMPVEAVRQMEKIMRQFFEGANVPYDTSHLKAALQMCHLLHPNLPPIYAEFVASSILLLYRLIEEQETGLVASPVTL